MIGRDCTTKKHLFRWYITPLSLFISFGLLAAEPAQCQMLKLPAELNLPKMPSDSSAINLKEIPYKIVYETYRDTQGTKNWELFMMSADGSDKINLTKTPNLDEIYPHVSPDGTKLCFVVDEGTNRRNKVR